MRDKRDHLAGRGRADVVGSLGHGVGVCVAPGDRGSLRPHG